MPPPEQVAAALLDRHPRIGSRRAAVVARGRELRARRVEFLHRTLGDDWPDFSDAALLRVARRLARALSRRHHAARAVRRRSISPPPCARGSTTRERAARRARADAYRRAERLAHRHRLRRRRCAGAGRAPPGDVRRDGDAARSPAARCRCSSHLLSPAGRPLQVTRDLAGFWTKPIRKSAARCAAAIPSTPGPTTRSRQSRPRGRSGGHEGRACWPSPTQIAGAVRRSHPVNEPFPGRPAHRALARRAGHGAARREQRRDAPRAGGRAAWPRAGRSAPGRARRGLAGRSA